MFTLQQNVNSIETEHGFVVTTHYYVTEEKRIFIHTKKRDVDFSDTVGGGGGGGGGGGLEYIHGTPSHLCDTRRWNDIALWIR